jgi:hypothetical protein
LEVRAALELLASLHHNYSRAQPSTQTSGHFTRLDAH